MPITNLPGRDERIAAGRLARHYVRTPSAAANAGALFRALRHDDPYAANMIDVAMSACRRELFCVFVAYAFNDASFLDMILPKDKT